MLEHYVTIKTIEKITSFPNKSFSIRGLASAIGISPGASRTALDYMHKKGIVSLNVVGRTYQYKAKTENPLCRQWKILFNIDSINDSGIVEELTEKVHGIHSILLYGSFGKGTNDEKSDIDLLIICQKPEKIVFNSSNKIKRELNISLITFKEWKNKAIKEKAFYESVIYDSIVLFGERPVVL
ncbi:nucleotidyltransferase domain-containing protein [Candidatus Micrarchaeota archaeon]|nr:nucleotidyltransferase domain-containing protein [Candidatus Micrarchaeota archaeon]MBU2476595.1 nucleotidyltransferase domain-containing protein [Candidatus Micrarchaeota archaeon]